MGLVVAGQPQENVEVVLVGAVRYGYSGRIYQKGVRYLFNDSDARALLGLRLDNGKPVFVRANPIEPVVEVKPEVQVVDMTSTKVGTSKVLGKRPTPAATDVVKNEAPDPKARVDVGSDDELREMGIKLPTDEGSVSRSSPSDLEFEDL